MGEFPESIKKSVREKAHFRCCRCQNIGVEVHHIIPQKDGGPDDMDNAAPLCSKCHDDFGDNPSKRKEIRAMRDWWYKKCEEMYKIISLFEKKPEPRSLTKEMPIVFFYHKESGNLYWYFPNKFLNYYHGAAFATQQLNEKQPDICKKLLETDYATFFISLVERTIFAWLSLTYHFEWLFERKRWKFPWMETVYASMISHPEVESETIKYSNIKGFKDNIFFQIPIDFESFVVPKGTTIVMLRNKTPPETIIRINNDYYSLQLDISFNNWFHQMEMPEWLSGLKKDQQKEFATVIYNVRFQAEPNSDKLNDDKMYFYQKWIEDLFQELQYQFNWLATFNQIKDEQIVQIREMLDG